MITADAITCRVPSETAVKLHELYCTVANPVASADSQTWAAWAGVLVALFAVVFAWNAWNTSRRANTIAEENLKHAKESLALQLRETKAGLQEQIAAMNELSLRENQLNRMQAYLEFLMRFAHSAASFKKREDGQSQFDHDKGELTILWGTWSAYLIGQDEELRDASSEMNSMFVNLASEVQIVGKKIKQRDWNADEVGGMAETIRATSAKQDHLFASVGNFVAMMQAVAFRAAGHNLTRQKILENAKNAKIINQFSK